MLGHISKTTKLLGMVLIIGLASACSTHDVSEPRFQFVGKETTDIFDESRLSFGQRLALAEGGFTTRFTGDNPYFSR